MPTYSEKLDSMLVSVETYQEGGLDYLENSNCAIATFNKKFKDFEKLTANLGDTVTFKNQVQYNYTPSLNAEFQGTTQPVNTLIVGSAGNVAFAFDDEEYLFNAEECMPEFTQSAIMELSTNMESQIFAGAILPSFTTDKNNVTRQTNYGTYLTSYAGITGVDTKQMAPINSYEQLDFIMKKHSNAGAAKGMFDIYLPDIITSAIIGSGLNQFAIDRNNETANSWQLGSFSRGQFYESNLMPIHSAGTIGNEGQTMTVVAINAAGTQLTLNGVSPSTATLNVGAILEFNDSVAGRTNLRYLTYFGHVPSAQKVQVNVQSTTVADGSGTIVVDIYPALISDPSNSQRNINTPIVAGMTLFSLPDHLCGFLVSGKAAYFAMPRLPTKLPFPSASQTNIDTGASLRVSSGAYLDKPIQGVVVDQIWGQMCVPRWCRRIALPIYQSGS